MGAAGSVVSLDIVSRAKMIGVLDVCGEGMVHSCTYLDTPTRLFRCGLFFMVGVTGRSLRMEKGSLNIENFVTLTVTLLLTSEKKSLKRR